MSTDGVLRLLTWYLANGIAVHAVARDRDRPQDHRGLRGVGAVAGYTGLRLDFDRRSRIPRSMPPDACRVLCSS